MRWARIKATAVHDPDGGVRLAINVIEDITELKRSEESQRFLAEASRRLSGSSLDYELTLAAVAELAVPAIADRCVVRLADDDDGRRAARGRWRCMRTGAAWLEPARMIVPMTAGRVIGTLTLEVSGRVYDSAGRARGRGLRAARRRRGGERAALPRRVAARAHAADLAAAAAAARTSRARRWRRRSTPPTQGLEVGGDFYDVFTTGEGQWYLVIGDVCGKGAEAAAVTALARYTLRTAAARRRSPAAILRWVGEAMLDQDAAGGRFCTIACAHLDLARTPARVTVSCGGHPLPVLRRADGTRRAARRARDAARAAARSRAAGPQHRPAAGRHARALHRRADRGARAARHVGLRGARGRGPGRADGRPGGAGRRAWSRARSAIARRRATTSRSSRSSST